jgi:hypothetical protein
MFFSCAGGRRQALVVASFSLTQGGFRGRLDEPGGLVAATGEHLHRVEQVVVVRRSGTVGPPNAVTVTPLVLHTPRGSGPVPLPRSMAAHPVHRIELERDVRTIVRSRPTNRHAGTGQRNRPVPSGRGLNLEMGGGSP